MTVLTRWVYEKFLFLIVELSKTGETTFLAWAENAVYMIKRLLVSKLHYIHSFHKGSALKRKNQGKPLPMQVYSSNQGNC